MAAKAKKQKTTLEKYKYYRNWRRGLTAAKFAGPAVPFGVILGLNWNNWVGNDPTTGWTIGVGFGMLAVATIASIVAIWKKDKFLESKVSGVFYVAIVFALIGFAFKLLAAMINQMGDMFLYVSLGIVGSGVIDQVAENTVAKKADFYEKLVKENGLDKQSARMMDDAEAAKAEGEQAKLERKAAEARRRAVE